jgi:hypothetical protein
MSEESHLPFHQVLRAELEDIRRRRLGPPGPAAAAGTQPADGAADAPGQQHEPPKGKPAAGQADASTDDLAQEREQQQAALNVDLAGLALSGGGIRSATFALGFLQGLASFNLLRHFDYLSTVSGGGYIGSWLAAWIRREGDIGKVEQQLKPTHLEQAAGRDDKPGQPMDEEPEPIYHLRAYSSYLAPHRGLFSADSWVLVAIYLRNIFLNQLVLFPACIAALLVPRLLERFYDWAGEPMWDWPLLWAMFVALGVAVLSIAGQFLITHSWLRKEATQKFRVQHGVQLFHGLIVLPLVLFAVLASWFLSWDVGPTPPQEAVRAVGLGATRTALHPADIVTPASKTPPWWTAVEAWLPWDQRALKSWEESQDPNTSHWLSGALLFGTVFGALVALLYTPFQLLRRICGPDRVRHLLAGAWALVSSFVAGFTGGALIYSAFAGALKGIYYQAYDVALVTTVGTPLVLVAIMVGISVFVGLLGTLAEEDEREWWASLCGWLWIYLALWVAGVGVALLGPWLLVKAGAWGQTLLGTGWAATAAGGIWAGKSSRTGSGGGNRPMEWLALAAPPVFLVGFLVLIGLLIDWAQDNVPGTDADATATYFVRRLDDKVLWLALLTLGCILFACLTALRIDVNAFSLHGLYANRLVRCYLGASRRKARGKIDRHPGAPANSRGELRQPDPVTGFDPADDVPLHRLRIGSDPDTKDQGYWGPYPLLNTALNLVQGDELAWQERKAESFVLTPRYCGSLSTRYSLLEIAGPAALRLGTAVALSGAAVTPNMGYHSSPAVTALLTVFNVRLGGWVANPRYGRPTNMGPRLGWLYFFKELFGRTNDRARYVYLSDGGHFDNMGVYELVRRRCRYIVVCDGEQDGDYVFGGLSSVVRKCQIDFGVPIEIDVNPIRLQGAEGRSRWHCAIGRIRYESVQPDAVPGVLVYVKASMTGDEPSDVCNYAQEHPSFPHQTTADQFFTESQFESYRALGYHIARQVFCDAVGGVEASMDRTDAVHRRVVNKLFSNLHSRWFPPPPGFNENFLQSVNGYIEIEKELRTDPNLRDFSRSLYPELGLAPITGADGANGSERERDEGRAEHRYAELHLVSQMLQVMEDAWLSLHLEGYFAHPMNRGWMNTFRRWTSSENFRRCWPILRGEFSKDFVRFCEKELGLNAGTLRAEPIRRDLLAPDEAQKSDLALDWKRRALRSFQEEFSREWPREERLERMLGQAWEWGREAPSVWLLVLAPEDGQPAPPVSESGQAAGIVLMWQPDPRRQELELLVWMRGPYRDLGLGRKGIEAILAQLKGLQKYQAMSLRARYPREAFACQEDKQPSAMWRTFLTFYGFRPTLPTAPDEQHYEVLKAPAIRWQPPS